MKIKITVANFPRACACQVVDHSRKKLGLRPKWRFGPEAHHSPLAVIGRLYRSFYRQSFLSEKLEGLDS